MVEGWRGDGVDGVVDAGGRKRLSRQRDQNDPTTQRQREQTDADSPLERFRCRYKEHAQVSDQARVLKGALSASPLQLFKRCQSPCPNCWK